MKGIKAVICWFLTQWNVLKGMPMYGHNCVELYGDEYKQLMECKRCGHRFLGVKR